MDFGKEWRDTLEQIGQEIDDRADDMIQDTGQNDQDADNEQPADDSQPEE